MACRGSPRRVAGSTYLRTFKHKSTFKYDCMEGLRAADKDGQKERGSPVRRRRRRRDEEERIEKMTEEVLSLSDRKVILQQVAQRRSFGQFSLDVKTLIRVSELFSELCQKKKCDFQRMQSRYTNGRTVCMEAKKGQKDFNM